MVISKLALPAVLIVAGSTLAVGFGAQGSKAHRPVAAPVTYKTVAPIFAANCVKCHQGARAAHGLDMSSYASIMKGDKESKVLKAGAPQKSRLALVLHGKPKLMPPGHALAAADIAKIEAWIKAGAKQ